MRYDDQSQGDHNLSAHDDYDVIKAGTGRTATGNAITGRGTVSGAAGADDTGNGGAHVTAITGAGGGQGASMEAAGRYGSIKIDGQGNYTYTRNQGSPENVEDVFTYTLADKAGMVDSARLIIRIEGKEDKAEVQANAQRVVAGTDLITLPAGVQLSDIHVVGRDLVITLPDGGQMVIVDGAVFVPQLALGDVAVPSDTLAALLIDSEPRPAAGPPQSSGGNFAVPVAPLDPGVPLGDLLPPTELSYTPPTFKETYIPLVQPDNIPEIFIQPDGQPAAVAAVDAVDEAGLPARPGEPAGSNSAANSEFANGNIVFTSPDGVATITITVNGTAYVVYGTGAVTDIPGDYGTLHINSVNIAAGTISYTYTLLDNVNHATDSTPYEDFSVTLVDSDGDPATATLRINIADDMPHANADVDSVVEDGVLVADGNVFTGVGGTDANATDGVADVQGADGAHVSGFSFGGTAGTFGVPLNGMYGELVLGSDGSYKYTLHNSDPAVQALKAGETRTDVYTYTITDGDGNTSTTTLTITVTGTNDRPVLLSGSTSVTEEAFVAPHSPGNPDNVGNPTDNANAATSSGNLSLSDPDGDALTVTLSAPAGSFTSHGAPVTWSVSADGHTLTGSANGSSVIVVTIDNAGHYTVNLLAQLDHPITGTTPATSEDILSIVVPVHANDGSVTVDGSLTVNVEDDSPIINGEIGLGAGVDIDESNSGTPVLSPAGAITVTSAGAIISAPISYGGDGPGAAPVYSITLNDANSGLLTADGDHPITLVQVDATHINGVFNDGADKVAFSITINANGSITVTQNYALEHTDDGNTPIAYNDTNSPLTLSGLITAHVVYEDYDHDTVSASANIGQLIRFFDDGPSVQVSVQLPTGQALDGLALVTSDDGTEGPGSTSDSTTANFGGAFTVTANGGADGLASSGLTFDLSLLGGSGPINSGLTSHGQIVYLFQLDANTIIAATSMTAVGAGDPSAVFALQTTDSGIVTLTQYQQIDHPAESPSGAPFADQSVTLDPGLIALVGTGSAVDNDGDYANDVQSLDLGGLVRFVDDGPAISVSFNQGASLHIDESVPGTDGPGETDAVGLGQVTVALSSLLTVTDVQVSADSPTTYGYALLLGPATGGLVDSGLMTSDGNHPIYLYNVGGVIVGSTATDGNVLIANTVFTVELSGGNVVMTQYQAIEHTDTTSFDENSSPLATGALILQVTATDFDHDTDVKTVDLGSIITFGDDGPNAVDHTLPGTQPEGANVVIDVTADIDGGSDGLDHVEIVSKTGAGALTYDPVTHQFTYVPAAGEQGDISFVYRVFDKDGDHDDATVSFTLDADSKPTVVVQDLTVDEKGLPLGTGELADPAPNTDNSEMASGSMTITTGNDSLGKVEVQDKDGSWIDVTAATVGSPVLVQGSHGVLSVTSDGSGHYSYTYTLTAPYTHPDHFPVGVDGDGIRGVDDPIAGDNFAVRVTDNEGDQTSSTPAQSAVINVTVLDDAPVASISTSGVSIVHDETPGVDGDANDVPAFSFTVGSPTGIDPDGPTPLGYARSSSVIDTTDSLYGADGPGTTVVSLDVASKGIYSGVQTTEGVNIYLFNEGGTVVGRVGATAAIAEFGPAAFALRVDGSNHLEMVQFLSVHNPTGGTSYDEPQYLADNVIKAVVTVTDGDLDQVVASAFLGHESIGFQDDGPSIVAGSVTGAVGEDALAWGNPDVGDAKGVSTGALSLAGLVNFGVDGSGGFKFDSSALASLTGQNLTSGGTALSYSVSVDGLTLTAYAGTLGSGNVFTVSLSGDSATFTLIKQIDHLGTNLSGSGDDQIKTIDLGGALRAYDGDGDSIALGTGKFVVTVEDDIPIVSGTVNGAGAVMLDETATTNVASTITLGTYAKGDDPDVANGSFPGGAIAHTEGTASVINASVQYGADLQHAAPSLTYALSIIGATSGLRVSDGTALGSTITLHMDGNVIVGVVDSGIFANKAAFAISIDPTSGVLTVEQYLSLQHPDTGNPDDPVSMSTGHIGVVLTATDGDNDSVSSSAVDISTQVVFKDDGPTLASGTVTGAVGEDALAWGNPDVGDAKGVSTGALSLAGLVNFGVDGSGGFKFDSSALASLTGQNLTSGGTALSYSVSVDGLTLTAYAGTLGSGNVFTVSLSGDSATFTLIKQIDHLGTNLSGSGDDQIKTIDLGGALRAYDGDGDSIALGTGKFVVTVEDDIPIVSGTVNGAGAVMLDETATTNVASTITLGTYAKGDDPDVANGSFPGGAIAHTEGTASVINASVQYGADLQHAAPSLTYALSIIGATSGLRVSDGTALGSTITLHMDGNVIVGVVDSGIFANKAAFAISIDPTSGVLTVEQYLSLQHPDTGNPDDPVSMSTGHIGVVLTATDGDNDSVSSSAVDISTQVVFKDDGPTLASGTVTGAVGEDTLPNGIPDSGDLKTTSTGAMSLATLVNFGADGPGTFKFDSSALASLTSQNLAAGGTALSYSVSLDGQTLTAYAGAAIPANLVFTLTLSGTSATFVLSKAIDHLGANLTGSGDDQIKTIDFGGVIRAYDGDGDSIALGSNKLLVQVEDDIPTQIAPDSASVTNNSAGYFSGFLDADHSIVNNLGADGGKAVFDATGLPSLTAGGGQTVNYQISSDGQTLIAYIGSDPNSAANNVFTAHIVGSTYNIDMGMAIDSLTTVDFLNGGYSHNGGNPDYYAFYKAAVNPSPDLLLTPAAGGSSVNLNANLYGIGSGNDMGVGDVVRLDYVTDIVPSGGNIGDWTFAGHYNVNGATVGVAFGSNSTARFTAYDDTNNNQVVGDGTIDPITKIAISYGAGSLQITPTTTYTKYTVGGHDFWVILNGDGSVSVGGLAGNANGTVQSTVAVYTVNGYNSMTVGYEAGPHGADTFKIGGSGAAVQSTAPVNFDIPVHLIDGDGDTTSNVNIHVTATTPAPPVVLDTNHDGQIGFLAMDHGVMYDMNGDGHLDYTAWVAPGDSILFFDADGNGTVSGANEFVFGHDGMTDLEALHAMYGDQLDANDAAFTMFGLWNDANSNGIVDAGEVQTLAEAGITSISLVSDGVVTYEVGGDVAVNGTGTYTYVNDNGDQVGGKLADASFRFQAQSAELEQRIATSATNASLLAIAAAAAGLAQQVAASTPVADDNHRVAPEPVVNVTPTITPETVIDGSSDPQVSPLIASDDAKVVEAAPTAHHNAVVVEQSNIIIDSAGHDDSAPQALPQGSDGPTVDMTPLIDVAPLTVMAEASPADVDGAKHHAVVASQIIEQPDTTVDQILAKVAGNAAIESLAQVQSGPKAVQGWDTADFGHLPAAIIEHIVADASLLHPDAVQPVMHG